MGCIISKQKMFMSDLGMPNLQTSMIKNKKHKCNKNLFLKQFLSNLYINRSINIRPDHFNHN